jgi:hypothetical protein
MARITSDEVKEIMLSSALTNDQIDPFILSAHLYVNRVYTGNSTLKEIELKEIERWFTAHMIASSVELTTTDEKIGDASVTYAGKFGKGLESTRYGQMVLQLDTTGLMANTGAKQASMTAIISFDE